MNPTENYRLKKRLEIAKYVSDELKKFDNVKMVALTGSCAIGCPTEQSDIDFQVAFGATPDAAELKNIRKRLLRKYGRCRQNKSISIGEVFALTIEGIDVSIFYGKAEDFKRVAFCGDTIGKEGESSLSVYYDMIPLYDSLNICGYIRDHFEYTDEKQREITAKKIARIKDLFNYEALKISGNSLMFLKYKYEIIENIVDIIYSINKRPKRMVNDFAFMGDRLRFYPTYLLPCLNTLASENETDAFNRQAKELLIKIADDSSIEMLKQAIEYL